MEPDKTPPWSAVGYLVVLLGAAGWVLGCFLPLYRITEFQTVRITLYRQISVGSFGIRLGGVLYLFGGIFAIGVFSIIGVRMRQPWNVVALAGAVVVWFLVSIGVLITLGASASQFDLGSVLGAGYWCLWASIGCVVVGTVMVLISARRGRTEAPQEQITASD